ncbi:MAG: hypothetical protein OES32_15210 [Acidobacteriota bacterium]|nr:hypothetical protein [Acidobacteriota bacterium]MDH3524930.1 hypothetical protein [Acidobacteriota bacterium]
MNRKLDKTLNRWLRFERAGDGRRAERELHRLLTALPPASVPAGFADRVLAASGVPVRGRSRRGVRPWIWRTAFGCWVVSGFLAAAVAVGFAADLARSGQLVALGSKLVVGLGRLGTETLAAVGGLWRAAEAVSAALSGPATLLLVLACALSSLMALRALHSVMALEGSSRHA